VEAFDLVNAIAHSVERFIKVFFLADLTRGLEYETTVGPNIVVDLSKKTREHEADIAKVVGTYVDVNDVQPVQL
jgi:hypothetical protein